MKNIFFILSMLVIPSLVHGQGKRLIAEKKVESQTVYEYFLEEGVKEPLIEKIEHYDARGNMIEQKSLNREGGLKSWLKWEYDENDNLIKEETLDEKGRIEEKVVYVYANGLLSEKQYFDRKDRLYKRKEYKYEYRGEN